MASVLMNRHVKVVSPRPCAYGLIAPYKKNFRAIMTRKDGKKSLLFKKKQTTEEKFISYFIKKIQIKL
jgi:hypothetical protein